MDFKAFKEKAIKFKNSTVKTAYKLKDKTIELKDNAIVSRASDMAKSSLVINTKEDLNSFIAKSKNTTFTYKETGVTKEIKKHFVVIFVKKKTDFYKDAMFQISILKTKAWSSSIPFKICDLFLKDLKEYKIKKTPTLALFTNEKLVKIVEWEENIKTIVKTLNIDIIKTIENID